MISSIKGDSLNSRQTLLTVVPLVHETDVKVSGFRTEVCLFNNSVSFTSCRSEFRDLIFDQIQSFVFYYDRLFNISYFITKYFLKFVTD